MPGVCPGPLRGPPAVALLRLLGAATWSPFNSNAWVTQLLLVWGPGQPWPKLGCRTCVSLRGWSGYAKRGLTPFWVAALCRWRHGRAAYAVTLPLQAGLPACPQRIFGCSSALSDALAPGRRLYFPPTMDELLAWSVLFRSAGTFANYLSYVRTACTIVRAPTQACFFCIGKCGPFGVCYARRCSTSLQWQGPRHQLQRGAIT